MSTNAILLEVAAPGPLTANGDPGEPEVVWTGTVPGYLKRTRRQVLSGGLSVNWHRDVFTVLRSALAPPIRETGADWRAYTVVISDRRALVPERRRFTVRGMENRAAGTVADSVRLELDGETAA